MRKERSVRVRGRDRDGEVGREEKKKKNECV